MCKEGQDFLPNLGVGIQIRRETGLFLHAKI